jgi:hypothetical protein
MGREENTAGSGQDGTVYQLKTEASGTVGTGTGPPVPADDDKDKEPG